MPIAPEKPIVMIVGGADVDARIPLMLRLADQFTFIGVGSKAELIQNFEKHGFSYYYYSLDRRTTVIADLHTLVALWQIFREYKPDIIHTFDTKPSIIARLAAKLAGVPIIIGTLPGIGSLYVDPSPKDRLVRTIYERLQFIASRFSDMTIFQNYDDLEQFSRQGLVNKDKAIVILGSGVDTNYFDPARIDKEDIYKFRSELNLDDDTILVTMISRLIKTKGLPEFHQAAHAIMNSHPHIKFLLVGSYDNESIDALSPKEVEELTIAVTWLGTRSDIPLILASSDIFVLPTNYREGIPRVLLESASMGLPIVTTDMPGCREVVQDNLNGLLVHLNDPTSVAQAVLKLAEDEATRIRFGQLARERAIKLFDLSVVVQQTRDLYTRLLANQH